MNAYTEPQLQRYVEENLEREGHKWFDGPLGYHWWCEPQHKLRLLGTEVQCSAGRIDILASLDRRPLIIELKAKQAEDAVNGQVARYRSAVARRYGLIRMLAEWRQKGPMLATRRPGYQPSLHDFSQDDVMTCIIAPGFSDACYHGLGGTHPLVARLDETGRFEITQLIARRTAGDAAQRDPLALPPGQLTNLLMRDAIESVGADIGSKWVDGMCDALNRRDFPERHYHVSEA